MQKENSSFVPFRATRLWDEAIRVFTNGMPSKRHRSNLKVFENCFTGSEAVKWFLNALEANPHFNSVITQEKTIQLLSKFYEEGIFISAKGSSRQGPDRFKLHGIYQMGTIKPQYTARTPLSAKNGLFQHKSENWIRKSLHKGAFTEYENLPETKKLLEIKPDTRTTYQNIPLMKPRLVQKSDCGLTVSSKVSCDKVQKMVAQHPIQCLKEYSQQQEQRESIPQQELYYPPETDDIWRKVFINRLQSVLKDVDVSGLLWPSAVIRCQWLEQNCCILDDFSVAKFPPWVSASSSRLLNALADKSLNRSVVNPDIEADVSALEAFFSNLHTPLIPADLSSIFLRVFLHLELAFSPCKEDDAMSQHSLSSMRLKGGNNRSNKLPKNVTCTLPPNTCFETAFTSESPVTRIVPQSSFDTLHLPVNSVPACASMKRNASIPKLFEQATSEDKNSANKSSAPANSMVSHCNKFSTIGGSKWQSQSKLKKESHFASIQREMPCTKPNSDLNTANNIHNCGRLTVVDRTPPLPPRHLSKPPPVLRHAPKEDKTKHTRSHSGGYVNLALQDSFDGTDLTHKDLDIEAAMETLQKLMICSQKSPVRHYPRKDGAKSVHIRSASLSQAQVQENGNAGGMRRSQSCWTHDLSNASLSSYHTAVSSSSSSLDSTDSESSISSSTLNLTAGCEWGWDWGSDAEQTGVAVFRLLLLLVKPQSRAHLQLILKLMGLLPYQCPYTTLKILDMFSLFIMVSANEDATSRLIGFLVRHQKEIFVPPHELVSEVQRERRAKIKDKFEEQKLTTSQKALAELLDQIINDQKMNPKEKRKKLKMFKESYPHIYAMKFPEPEVVTFKKRNRAILQLARLRSLRV